MTNACNNFLKSNSFVHFSLKLKFTENKNLFNFFQNLKNVILLLVITNTNERLIILKKL